MSWARFAQRLILLTLFNQTDKRLLITYHTERPETYLCTEEITHMGNSFPNSRSSRLSTRHTLSVFSKDRDLSGTVVSYREVRRGIQQRRHQNRSQRRGTCRQHRHSI